jgi:serine phosphatase RsbU (regulator of sigma subunit)
VNKLLISLLFFVINLQIYLFGQRNEQFYLSEIEKCKSDTCKINNLLELSILFFNDNYSKSLKYVNEAHDLALESEFKLHKIYNLFSGIYLNQNDTKKSLDYAFKLLNYSKKLNGNDRFDYEARAYEKLATIYSNSGNIDYAIKYQSSAVESYKKMKGDNYYFISMLNLASFFNIKKNYKQALYYYEFIEENLESEKLEAYSTYLFNAIAVCYKDQNNFKKAFIYYEKSIDAVLKYTPDDKSSLAIAYNNIGNLYNDEKKHSKANEYLTKAMALFKEIDDKKSLADVYYNLSVNLSKLNDFQQSNVFMMEYIALNDTINNIENRKTIHDLAIKYESEKKEQENKILSQENEKKQLSIYFSLAALSLVFLILLIIFRNNRIKAKINKKLEFQNNLIEEQKKTLEKQHFLLEEKNKEVTDSIKYAERIQGAILPPDQKWNYILPNSFVLNKPKDILSGDFYWIAETEESIFVAAADCTGHGVPGALISIVNFNLLNKAVLERGLSSPAKILDAVNQWLTESLNQTDEESTIKDGMDISLISINKLNGQVLYAGANNPLYLFKNNELFEYKADKFPVGAYINEQINQFTDKEIDCKYGDTIYLFSDGFADQFGGEFGKKYKYRQFKEKLFEAKSFAINEQKDFLHREYINWRGKHEQTDDILVIGIKL